MKGLDPIGGSQSGMAFYAALIAVIVVAGVVTSLTHMTQRDTRGTVLERARATSLAAADGGIELARARLARDRAYTGERATIGAVEVTVRVEAVPSANGATQRWRVRSIASARPNGPKGLPVVRVVDAELSGRRGLPAVASWRAR